MFAMLIVPFFALCPPLWRAFNQLRARSSRKISFDRNERIDPVSITVFLRLREGDRLSFFLFGQRWRSWTKVAVGKPVSVLRIRPAASASSTLPVAWSSGNGCGDHAIHSFSVPGFWSKTYQPLTASTDGDAALANRIHVCAAASSA